MKNLPLKKAGCHKTFRILFLLLFLLLLMPMRSQASQSKDVQKILKYYKNGKYATANRIAKKYENKTANEKKYRNKLSKKAKKAYKKVLKSYRLYDTARSGKYLWDYFVKDLDGKGQPELCIYYGSCEADVRLRVYRYSSGKARFVTEQACSHGCWSDIPGKRGVIYSYSHMGDQMVSVVTLKGNKLVFKNYGSSSYSNNMNNYVSFPFKFKNHITYKEVSKSGKYRSVGVLSYSGVK